MFLVTNVLFVSSWLIPLHWCVIEIDCYFICKACLNFMCRVCFVCYIYLFWLSCLSVKCLMSLYIIGSNLTKKLTQIKNTNFQSNLTYFLWKLKKKCNYIFAKGIWNYQKCKKHFFKPILHTFLERQKEVQINCFVLTFK